MSRLAEGLGHCALGLLLCTIALGTQAATYDFQQLLADGGLTMTEPDGYERLPTAETALFAYEYALRHQTKKLAVRYAVRPVKMVEIDYQDPHSSAPDPNHLFPMLFQTLISDLSYGGRSPSRELSSGDADKYNADWAAMAVMDVTPEFAPGYRQMLLLALHKNFASDAYVMVLFDDYADVEAEIDQLVDGSLKFLQADTARSSP